MSIEPSLRVTIARLVFLRLPKPNLVRRVLPWRLRVLTESTLTPKTRSTAILISVLLARGSTTKVYLPSSSRPYDFSDTTGASRMSRGSLFNVFTWCPPCHPQPLRAWQPLGALQPLRPARAWRPLRASQPLRLLQAWRPLRASQPLRLLQAWRPLRASQPW